MIDGVRPHHRQEPAMQSIVTLKVYRLLSASILALGFALMAMMIATEGEPGLLPLVLVVLGAGWSFVTWARLRSRRG
jgi:FtsH-binding integral membrane protein